ncbi:aminoglycoside phosphotransferase family protein [Streptomyces sp. NPDC056405]|uniref:aminoglycoside phosphotransferase family protein n=1 Tax=Streptomyces sp. NPDC056405 TaxID=3345811 RepID=UPI0035DF4081
MNQPAPIHNDLWAWALEHLPGARTSTDVSWARGDSRVWRIDTTTTSAYAKISPSVRDYERETDAYAYAARALAPHQAPRLIAADHHLLALLTTPQPGRIVRGLPLDENQELRVHEAAGRLLRRWHDHSAPATADDRTTIHAAVTSQADEAAACLQATHHRLTPDEQQLVEDVTHDLPHLADELPLVYRHGDYATRNWLWEPKHGLGVIDFAMAAPGIAVEEFVWLHSALWTPQPSLRDAFFAGYGRPLTDTERQALPLFAARLGVSYLRAGLTKQDPVLTERGHLVLHRMTADRN